MNEKICSSQYAFLDTRVDYNRLNNGVAALCIYSYAYYTHCNYVCTYTGDKTHKPTTVFGSDD